MLAPYCSSGRVVIFRGAICSLLDHRQTRRLALIMLRGATHGGPTPSTLVTVLSGSHGTIASLRFADCTSPVPTGSRRDRSRAPGVIARTPLARTREERRGVAAVSTATTVTGGALPEGVVDGVVVWSVEVVQPVKITARVILATAASLRVRITPDVTSTGWSSRPCRSRPARWRRRPAWSAPAL